MTASPNRILSLAAAIALVISLTTVAGGTAFAGIDNGPRPAAALRDGRSPDTIDAASAILSAGMSSLPDGRSPDTRDAALAARATLLTPVDGRSPDTHDAATMAHAPVVTVTLAPGFDWGDFGVGVAAALGLVLLVAVSVRLLAARSGSKQQRPVATA